ncbi:hypothetical protein VPNG_09635 [Cytospora leucostoma]|uniref:Uncharacterized protein n=1 Tax=Cytospora leucostoma TaxID=1230097 RepID=A0A423VR33_9PEZI|nr:hypothetical protein VPNG_09635 [Cytospora leucostoma]
MCNFTYLGYDRCDEPDRHYLIRREKCSAKAYVKQWCAPHEQDEAATAHQQGKFWVSLPCPMCADTPVIYDQPLLEIAHSRRSVLPAPHYDAVSGKYSRLPRHQTPPDELPENVIPRPLNMNRVQVRRAATESAVQTANRVDHQEYTLPATTYVPPPQESRLPKPLPIPQPVTLTPPSSREASRSPPQISMDGALRTTPPGEGNRRELERIREKARAASAAAKGRRPAATERSRSDSASSASSSSSSANVSSQPSQPSRKASDASISTVSSQSSKTTSTSQKYRPHWRARSSSRSTQQQDSSVADTFTTVALRSIGFGRSLSRASSPSNSSPERERGRMLRRRPTGGSSSERSDSPSVWRPTISPPVLQNDSLGIGSVMNEAENIKKRLVPIPPPAPTPPPVPAAPGKGDTTTPDGTSVSAGEGLVEEPPRPKTPHPHPLGANNSNNNSNNNNNNNTNNNTNKQPPVLRLFPNAADDEEVAAAAFERMFAAEARAHAYQVRVQAQAQADARAQAETQAQARTAAAVAIAPSEESASAGGGGGGAGASGYQVNFPARRDHKTLPPVPTTRGPIRRILSGQVRTVNVPPPRPVRRQNTTDGVVSSGAAPSSRSSSKSPSAQQLGSDSGMKVKLGPMFSLAGVGGGGVGKAQEFEIVTGFDGAILHEPALGQAF